MDIIDINFIEVPSTMEEDLNRDHTQWSNGKYVKMDEGKWVTYFVFHKYDKKNEDPENNSKDKDICLAIPVRIKKGDGTLELQKACYNNTEVFNAVIPFFEQDNIEIMRSELISKIVEYDKSKEVNTFFLDEIPMWLDLPTRSGLALRFRSEKELGLTETTLWYKGNKINLVIDNAIQMLYNLEMYASKCYDNTQVHLSVADKRSRNFLQYNFKTNYPEKLHFKSK